ncbi:MAG: STAS/SEC14 domain-containing protein [Rhodanobacter sp.]
MSIRLEEEGSGKVLAIRVSGTLTSADYELLKPEFERLIRQHGKIRMLFDMTDFHGWDAGAAWDDLKLDIKHHAHIERIAMVGDKQWQHVIATLCKPFTKATIRYFDHANAAAARVWVDEA